MKDEITISQEDLNSEMKKREREEYYEDKLLELKMQKFLDNYLIENELSKYKNKLSELNIEKESLLEEKENLLNKISEIKEAKLNYENTIKDLDTKIKEEENNKKKIENEIKSLQNMLKEENEVNYIIKNFSDEFKKEIYDICSKKVNEALKSNNSERVNNSKKEKNANNTGGQMDSKYTMVSSQREQFISYQQNTPTQQNNMQNTKKTNVNPMMYPPYNNGQFMMYPMMMPFPPHNMPGYQNPYFFYPVPMNPNMPQNKESYNDNNNTKNK
jgi:hypothetical protein